MEAEQLEVLRRENARLLECNRFLQRDMLRHYSLGCLDEDDSAESLISELERWGTPCTRVSDLKADYDVLCVHMPPSTYVWLTAVADMDWSDDLGDAYTELISVRISSHGLDCDDEGIMWKEDWQEWRKLTYDKIPTSVKGLRHAWGAARAVMSWMNNVEETVADPPLLRTMAATLISSVWRGASVRRTLSSTAGEDDCLGRLVLREQFAAETSGGASRAWIAHLRAYLRFSSIRAHSVALFKCRTRPWTTWQPPAHNTKKLSGV